MLVGNLVNGPANFSKIPGPDINALVFWDDTGAGSGPRAIFGVGKAGLFAGPLANLTVPFTSGGVNGIGLGGKRVTAYNASLGVGYVAQQSALAVLTVSSAPEPGTLPLFSCRVAGLALLGRRRWRT